MIPKNVIDWLKNIEGADLEIEDLLNKLCVLVAANPLAVKEKVINYLRFQPSLKKASIGEVACYLNMSDRTLSRKLKNENSSFQQLLDNERRRRCLNYLQNQLDNGAQLSELLGYSNPAYFYQAFKSWTHISYAEAKRKMAEKLDNIDVIFDV